MPWKKVCLCFISIAWVHFSCKNEKFRFLKPLKDNWYQIWICPVKRCLIWFKLCYLSRILSISMAKHVKRFFKKVKVKGRQCPDKLLVTLQAQLLQSYCKNSSIKAVSQNSNSVEHPWKPPQKGFCSIHIAWYSFLCYRNRSSGKGGEEPSCT